MCFAPTLLFELFRANHSLPRRNKLNYKTNKENAISASGDRRNYTISIFQTIVLYLSSTLTSPLLYLCVSSNNSRAQANAHKQLPRNANKCRRIYSDLLINIFRKINEKRHNIKQQQR